MHIYIYDTYVSDKKYASQIAKIETRITDLGLSGKIIRLGLVSSVDNAILSEIKKGAKTIVMVGGVKLLNQGVNALAKIIAVESLGQNVPLAFIPVGKDEYKAGKFLGLGTGEEACNTLSQRRMKKISLGQANDNYFLFSASIPTNNTVIEIDENYTIEIKKPGLINVSNLPLSTSDKNIINTDKVRPKGMINCEARKGTLEYDNPLELLIATKKEKRNKASLFPFKNLLLSTSKNPLTLDFTLNLNLPVKITAAKEKIYLIVGKEREF